MSTAKDYARAKSEAVQIVLKMYCVKRLLGVANPDDSMYAAMMERALVWWDSLAGEATADGFTEEELAQALIERVRQDPDSAWARILREGVN